jgi:23S rRNA pseudouridine1911/1915/1917 synthase
VVNKRVGDIVQGDKTGDKPLSEVVKEYIKEKYNKQVKFSLAWYIV